jgi:hypothetical protein
MQVTFQNLGTVNKNAVTIGDLEIVFSYETPVAFKWGYGDWVVRENDWSTTTGKLLNEYQPDKKQRISGEDFMRKLNGICNRMTIEDFKD